MNQANIVVKIAINLLLLFLTVTIAIGQSKVETPAAVTLRKLKAAVEANPDSLKMHEDFINAAIRINEGNLLRQYELWMTRFPKSAMVPFAIGKTYWEHDDTLGKKYLRKALGINPDMSVGWEYLSMYATDIGDKTTALEFMEKAAKLDPKNVDCAFKYAFLNRDGSPAKYDSLMLNMVYHFPAAEKSALALYYLASLPYNENEKAAYYEMIYQMYLKSQPQIFRAAMADYFAYLLNNSPDKAFELALRMNINDRINRGDWKRRIIVARGFIDARKLIDENKPAEAVEVLKHIDLGNSKTGGITIAADETLNLFKAEAIAACNKTKEAYDSVAMYYSKTPSARVRKALLYYAEKLNIDSNRADTDIWRIRNDNAWKQTDFTLKKNTDNKNVSLAGYRGKVVLLTYWASSCGPCKEEFPHFEAVLKKINSPDVVYLAIDMSNAGEEYTILPLIKNNLYTFVPLRDDPNMPKGNLPRINEIPTNFLFDQQGRVVFSDFQIGDKNEDTLELMITELLKMGNTGNNIVSTTSSSPSTTTDIAKTNK